MEGLPESVEAELARLRAEWAEFGLDTGLDKLMQRPGMVAVCLALAEKLSGPEAWRTFFFAVLKAANFAHLYFPCIKPDRQAFPTHRDNAIRAARELQAELAWLADGYHEGKQPPEAAFLWHLVLQTAARNGHDEAAAERLYAPLLADLESGFHASIQGSPGPAYLTFPDLLGTLADALAAWDLDHDSQGQGTAPGTVFVRALDDGLAKDEMDAKTLLSNEHTATLTRAALGLPESDAKGNRFGPGHVYDARKYAKKPD